MHSLADFECGPARPRPLHPVAADLAGTLELRRKALESKELDYSSPMVRLLIEDEIPRLVGMIAALSR